MAGHVSDFTKPSDQVVLDLINADNGTALPLNLLDLGLPTAEDGERNTSLTVTAKQGSGYVGSQTFTYNRLQLSVFAAGKDLTFSVGDAENLSDLEDEINAALGVTLRAGVDYADAPIPAFQGQPNETVTVDLVASADSHAYLGTLTISVKAEDIELASVLTVTQLDGLNEPAAQA